MENNQFTIFQNSDFTSLKNAALQALHTCVKSSAGEDFLEDYFWNNIVGDNIVLGEDGPDVPCPCGYLEFWESVLSTAYEVTSLNVFGAEERKRPHNTDHGISQTVDGLVKQFEEAVNLASCMRLSGRCFFTTANGMVGLGPANLQPGDMVAIIFGCSLPLVLRETYQQFRLVGPAYVHGIMHGEYIDGKGVDLMQIQEFTLR